MGAAMAALTLGLAGAVFANGALRALAHTVNNGGDGGCAWTANSFPVGTIDQGCSYLASTTSGEVVWSGSTTTAPSITGASSTPSCLLSGTVGECSYTQAIGAVITVSAPGSTAGLAGVPQPTTTNSNGVCTWTPPNTTCTLTVDVYPSLTSGTLAIQTVQAPGAAGLVSWNGGPAPLVTVSGASSSVTCTPTTGSGGCSVTLRNTTSLQPVLATVTIAATAGSSGVAMLQATSLCVPCNPCAPCVS